MVVRGASAGRTVRGLLRSVGIEHRRKRPEGVCVVHVNPALAGVLAAFAFGYRADAGLTIVIVPTVLLVLVLLADAVVSIRRRVVAAPVRLRSIR